MAIVLTDNIHYKNIANAIRAKNGSTEKYQPADMSLAIEALDNRRGSIITKDVNFYDYDGTLLYSYTLEEAQALSRLPPLPTRDGLICQGWNYDLATIKSYNRLVNIGAIYITNDGKTRIHLTLEDGRLSPKLGICPDGTVEIDWGDGTNHDILTGTSVNSVKWTPTHEYASAGEYIIKLTVVGSMGFYGASTSNQYSGILRYSSGGDTRNYVYRNAVQKIEIGTGVTRIGDYAFSTCQSLSSIIIPNGVTYIGTYAFNNCYSLNSIVIPNSVVDIKSHAFNNCDALGTVIIPNGAKIIGTQIFYDCYSLRNIVIPDSVTSIESHAFHNCYALSSLTIPDKVTSIETYAFYNCYSLSSLVIPSGIKSIGINTFYNCYSAGYYDFSSHTFVPTLLNYNAFTGIPSDCRIRVPTELYDKWILASNWSKYTDYIEAV